MVSMYLKRLLQKSLKNALETFPVILITGPRQSGKTTLVQTVLGKRYQYVSLDELDIRSLAIDDPNDATQVAAPLTPEGENPTHFAKYGDGGIVTVATIAERDAFIASIPNRDEVKLIYVTQAGVNGIIYRVETDGTIIQDPVLGAGTGSSSGAWIKTADILPQTSEIISNRVFRDSPNDSIIESASSDQNTISVFIRSAFPEVLLDDGTLTATALLPQAADGGHYEGNVDFTLSETSVFIGNVVIASPLTDSNRGPALRGNVSIV